MKRPSRETFVNDLKAGLTVGVVLVPQAVAYAILAGVPPIYGLYASLVPLIVYAFLGTSRHLGAGVNAIDMLVIAAGLSVLAVPGSDEYIELVFLLAIITGLIQILMGLFRMGFMINLLSRPVVTGFTSGAALLIAMNQLAGLLGIPLHRSSHIHVLVAGFISEISTMNLYTAGIGFLALALIVILKWWNSDSPAGLIAAVLGTAATWYFQIDLVGVKIVGELPSGFPLPSIPEISTESITRVLPTAGVLALFQFMTVVSLGRAYAGKGGYRVWPNRELLAIGTANVAGGFLHGIPVSGSFSRTAILFHSGRVTKLANAFAAIIVLLTIAFFTPLFYFLPEAVLSAIILVAVIRLVDWREAAHLLTVKRVDGLIAIVTFVATLFLGVVLGIAVGVAASVIAIMYRISRPHVAILGHVPGTRSYRDIKRYRKAVQTKGVLMLRLDASFSFANADLVRDIIHNRCRRDPSIHSVVLDGSGINDLDTTASDILGRISETLNERGIRLYITGLKGRVRDTIAGTKLADQIGVECLPMTAHRAMLHIQEEHGPLAEFDHLPKS